MNYTLIDGSLLRELENVYQKIYDSSENRELCTECKSELKKIKDSRISLKTLQEFYKTTIGKYYRYRLKPDETVYYKPSDIIGCTIYGYYLHISPNGIYGQQPDTGETIPLETLTDALIISSQDPRLQQLKEYCYYQDPFEKVFTEITESEYNDAVGRFEQFVKNENNR